MPDAAQDYYRAAAGSNVLDWWSVKTTHINPEDLAQLNPLVGKEELLEIENHREALKLALGGARLRLDSLRLIYKVPS